MNIWFFEEFPTKSNLQKAKLLNFNSVVFIAANSIKDFEKSKSLLKKLNFNIEAAYWPILKTSYWVSPFSETKELSKLCKDLKSFRRKTKVLLDLELPIMNSRLFRKNFSHFKKNKFIINEMLKINKNVEIFTAEYPAFSILKVLAATLGITQKGPNKIPMCYTSMTPPFLKFLIRKVKSHYVGLGTIAKGILKNEPILSPNELKKDLDVFTKNGSRTAVIFRLGGLNRNYLKVINNYL